MSDTVLAALIGAGSSIVVALIAKGTTHGKRLASRSIPGSQLPTPAWIVTLAVLALWLLISPSAIHHVLVGFNFHPRRPSHPRGYTSNSALDGDLGIARCLLVELRSGSSRKPFGRLTI